MNTHRILVVDDDSVGLESLVRGLRVAGVRGETFTAQNSASALDILRRYHPEVAIIDLSLNKHEGVEAGFGLLKEILHEDPVCRIIVLTGHAGSEFGVRALSLGAAHFISKPADLLHLAALIRDSQEQAALRRLLSHYQRERDHELTRTLIGKSAAAARLRHEVCFAARTNQSVFVRGETGTGKGLCAWLIHQLSEMRNQPFVRYQPLFGSPDLANSDLFGHKKGAFTGAIADRRGLLNAAHRGTLFLDEIDELPRESQVALLGVLHDRSFRALGDNQMQQVDFRLITASNAPIEERIEQGSFRRDLFHRIAHYQICIPPLRERIEDIPELIASVIQQFRTRHALAVQDASEPARNILAEYRWPGNVRELESVIESALWKAQYRGSSTIDVQDINIARSTHVSGAQGRNFHDQVQAFEEKLVQDALRSQSGSHSGAARLLGIDRGTVKRIAERSIP